MPRSYFQYLRELQEEFFRKNAEMVATPEEATRLFYQELEKDYIANVQDNPEIIYHDTAEFVSQMKMEGYEKFKAKCSYTPKLQFDSIFLYLYRLTRIQYIAAKKYKLDTGKLDELLLQRAAELNNNERPQGRTAEEIVEGILADIEALQAAEPPTARTIYNHIPFDQITHPNDKITKNLATATQEEWEQGELQVIEQERNGKNPQIITTVKFDIEQLKKIGFSKLDSFDFYVLFICSSIQSGGNTITTPNIIYKTMKGLGKNKKAILTPTMRYEILASIEKLRLTPVSINAEGILSEYGYVGKGNYVNDYLLPCKIKNDGSVMINGAIAEDAIEFYGTCPLVEIAKMKNNQIISYEKNLLNVPINTNRDNIVIPPYLIQRIKNAEHKEMRPTITIDTLIKDCNWKGERKRLTKIIEKCFDYWRDECNLISKYDIEKDGRGKAIKINFKAVKR